MTREEKNSPVRVIDSHAHLNDRRFAGDLEQVVQNALGNGLDAIICVGYDLESSRDALTLAKKYPAIYAVVGIHPHDAVTITDEALSELHQLAKDPKVLAIGEMGLDFYRNLSPKEDQMRGFRAQIRLAAEIGKPIVIHDRDAHQEVTAIIKEEKAGKNGGIMHCFSGHLPLAVELMRENFYISFAGPLTYKNAQKSVEVAAKIPLDRILVETDCPYLTPEPNRGKRNEPFYVTQVVKKLAEVRGITYDEAAYVTAANTRKVFRMK